ncbi:hypothetical protein AVEN_239335-1 [Araneus ventricosus]|uniref:Uncharacterized protein n=1 Tax=Araneus ventricosus TaxID=182803 RepID=A0A4Y2EE31_ARAVE|nr:hypothetical protein AVEN_239335-1 [Araneus ventricosus]
MCLALCRSEYKKAVSGCDSGMTMIPSVRNLCIVDFEKPNISSEQIVELQDKRLVCFQNCKQGCLDFVPQHFQPLRSALLGWVQFRIQTIPAFAIPSSPHVDERSDDGGTPFVLKPRMVVYLRELI